MYPKIVATKLHITPDTKMTHKICKNCKYFRKGFFGSVEYGDCLRFGEQNLVDGTITYSYAKFARKYDCKGDYFEEQEPSFYNKMFLAFKNIDAIKNNEEQ